MQTFVESTPSAIDGKMKEGIVFYDKETGQTYFKHPQDLQVPLLNDLLVTSFIFPHSHWHIQTNPPLIFLSLF